MTNEEKLREALQWLQKVVTFPSNEPISDALFHAGKVLKETAPATIKPEHPAIKAFYDWYTGEGPDEVTGIDKVVLERRRETFLAGYKAGVKSIATHIAKHGGEWIWMSDVDKIANEVPTT